VTVSYRDLELDWYGYATVRLALDDTVVYLDPGRYGVLTGEWRGDSDAAADAHPSGDAIRPEDGDLVCVTHVHHYDPDGIDRVAGDDATVMVCDGLDPRTSPRDLPRPADLPYDVVEVGHEAERVIDGVPLWTVPAYNEPDGPHTRADGQPYHPEGRGCGFLVSLGDTRVFWPGDTDALPGHSEVDVDVFLPPIGGAFTMDRVEAADLAAAIGPDAVVPIHYNTFEALETDSGAFLSDLAGRGVPVALDEGWRWPGA